MPRLPKLFVLPEDQEEFDKICKLPFHEIMEEVLALAAENIDLESTRYVEAARKHLRFDYRVPNSDTMEEIIKSGMPDSEVKRLIETPS